MKTRPVAILAALLAGIGVFAIVRCSGGGTDAPAAPTPPPAAPTPAATASPADAVPVDPTAGSPNGTQGREAAPRTAADAGTAPLPQGVRGLAVDDQGRPLADIRVFLLESMRNEPLTLPVLLQQGLLMGPLAETRSGNDGAFALGLHLANDKLYELHLLSPAHADVRLGDLRVLADQWHDVGAITMLPGTTVRGRVTIEGTTTPVPLAVVSIEAGTVFEDAVQRGLPGRERGLSAQVDATGYYELRHAPRRGVVQVSAVAPGFARVVRQNIELSATTVEVPFGLPPGLALAGQVVDAGGAPLARARIEAWPMQVAGNAEVALSRADGRFDVLGLKPGTYRVRVLARGYQDVDLPDQPAGRDDLRIAMRPRAAVALRVHTEDQRPLRSYQVAVRRHFPEQGGQIGLVAELPDQRVRLDGLSDTFVVAGVPPGTFVLQIAADGFARTLSAPFVVASDTSQLEVSVVMTVGGTLRGTVLDEAGRPLVGATVTTQANGATPDNPVWRMLSAAAPTKITPLRVQTDAQGGFVLPLLAAADYQLQVEHPDACRRIVRDLAVDRGERTLPPIVLPTGAVVFGRATRGGKVVGQIKVVLATIAEAGAGPDAAAAAIRLETVTDSAGAYQMPRRIPPGTYEVRAAVVGDADPDSQVFRQLLQFQRSATTLSVAAGLAHVEHHIDLPTDH